jgi:hypothetical protein
VAEFLAGGAKKSARSGAFPSQTRRTPFVAEHGEARIVLDVRRNSREFDAGVTARFSEGPV